MRIALVGNWPPPHGGVSVHVEALARVLWARGVDVRVLDIGRGDHSEARVAPARGPVRYAAGLAAVAAERRLVHLHTNGANPKSWGVALAAGRARLPGTPRGLLTIHSGLAPAWLAVAPGRRRLAAAACAGFARVIAVSEDIADALAAAGVPRSRISVVTPFSPAVLEGRAPPPGLAAFRAGHSPLIAAAVAPGPIYGTDLLLPAFAELRARLPRAGLVVFGPGAAALSGPGVLGLGEVPHVEALAVLEAADVFVRPTRADGDAVSVREALALGCTVVASALGERPPGCLLFRVGDPTALAARLAEAAAGRRPGAHPPATDPFDELLALYRAAWARRPLPDGGRSRLRAPTF
jgi:glycosyltransferase involved in cell wall biosynthesis